MLFHDKYRWMTTRNSSHSQLIQRTSPSNNQQKIILNAGETLQLSPALSSPLDILDDIGLKIQNVGHSFHLLPHTSLTKQWGYALQHRLVQESTRAALIEPETGWLANGDTHRQPPATYGKPESRPRSRSPFHPSRQTSSPTPVLRDTRRTNTTGTTTTS